MTEHDNLAGVTRPVFVVFALLALGLIVFSAVWLIEAPGVYWRITGLGVLCAAVLEIPRLPVGSVPHRTPVITLPIIAMLAMQIAMPLSVAVGVAVFGVLLVELLRTRCVMVSLYRAGLTAAGGALAVAVFEGLSAALPPALLPGLLVAAVSAVVYVAFVIAAETLRRRYAAPRVTPPRVAAAGVTEPQVTAPGVTAPQLGTTPARMLSLPRVLAVMTGCAAATVAVIYWSTLFAREHGGEHALAMVLLTLMVIVAGETLVSCRALMRRRLIGLTGGVAALNARTGANTPRSEAAVGGSPEADAGDLAEMLCRVVADTIGAQSVILRDQPARRGEIGVAVSLTEATVQHLVARRDPMDREFTGDDLLALRALARTADVIVQAETAISRLVVRANTDALTELPNYGAFQQALAQINATRGTDHEALAVLFLDLDDFKRLNDRFGHHVGDSVLQEVGRRLLSLVGASDVVARVGGDEFVVILTELSTLAEAKERAEEILDGVSEPVTVGDVRHSPVLSMGMAYSAHRETNIVALLHDADRSMLAVKSRRTSGESSLNISGHAESPLHAILTRALNENLLQLAFQPVVSLVTHEIWAFEALVRYTDADLGPISPPTLVDAAKGLGRLDDFTRQVGIKAMLAADELRLVDPRVVCMTFNVELDQLLPGRLGAFFEDLAVRHDGVAVCLELNERSVAGVSPEARSQIDHLRDLGILIALDDYGSQDSSVDALVRLPMDILKIDRTLVDDLTDVRQREVLTALQGFGDNLEYSMIVEGVENQFMADELRRIGIRAAQGFHYGMPETLEYTLARLERFGVAALTDPATSTGVTTATNSAILTATAMLATPAAAPLA